MTQSNHISILRRMAGQAADPSVANPPTPSRAVRLALEKAASDAGGLVLSVASTAEHVGRLDDVLSRLDDGLLLVGLHRQDKIAGFVALDMQLRAALVEIQTIGRCLDQQAEDRAATATDKALCDPLLTAFLAALPAAVTGTSYEGWLDDLTLGDRVASNRQAGLQLQDGDFRALHLTVNLGAADRQGQVFLVLPLLAQIADPITPVTPFVDWHGDFTDAVNDAQATLMALLHRFTIPLGHA